MSATAESRSPVATTVALIALAKRAKTIHNFALSIVAHVDAAHDAPVWDRGLGTARITAWKDMARGVAETFDIPARIRNGHTDAVESHAHDGRTWDDYSEAYEPKRGCVHFDVKLLLSALLSIPKHASLRLEVALDAHTTQNHVAARMHGDVTYLIATWTEGSRTQERVFVVESSTCLHNTARFGNPGSRF